MKHDAKVREEGLHIIHMKNEQKQEVDLEIEDPGAANSVAEEGAKTIQSEEEFKIVLPPNTGKSCKVTFLI